MLVPVSGMVILAFVQLSGELIQEIHQILHWNELVLLDSDDNAVTVFLQQCVTIEEIAGSYKMLSETYNKYMHISEAFKDSLQNLRRERAYTYHPINESDESQEISSHDTIILF